MGKDGVEPALPNYNKMKSVGGGGGGGGGGGSGFL